MSRVLILSADSPVGVKLLPIVLSLIAGSVDVISFLGLGGLFISHITGNLVILAVHVVGSGDAPLALILSVPVFIVVLGLTRLIVYGLDTHGRPSLPTLLWLQFLLLMGFWLLGVLTGSPIAGMLGVSAMAVQNALVQLSLIGAPATAVMTTNITRFMMDAGEVLLGRNALDVAKARRRAKFTWPAIVGFAVGCGVGAIAESTFGLWALALPACLALLALVLGNRYNN